MYGEETGAWIKEEEDLCIYPSSRPRRDSPGDIGDKLAENDRIILELIPAMFSFSDETRRGMDKNDGE